MEIKNRLDKIIGELGLSGRSFEKECGLANGSYASIGNRVGADKLKAILFRFPQINAEWLITGNGEMLKNPEKKSPEPIEEPTYSLPLSAWRVIESQMKSLETSVQQNKEVIEMLRHERKKTGNDAGGHFLAASAAGED